MKSFWDPAEAAKRKSDVELRLYPSRCPDTTRTGVLQGRGDTLAITREKNVGREEEQGQPHGVA